MAAPTCWGGEGREVRRRCEGPHFLYLIINCVKLGQHYSIDGPWLLRVGVVHQGTIELHQLVHGLIPNQRLPDEQDQVWLVHPDQLEGGSIVHTRGADTRTLP